MSRFADVKHAVSWKHAPGIMSEVFFHLGDARRAVKKLLREEERSGLDMKIAIGTWVRTDMDNVYRLSQTVNFMITDGKAWEKRNWMTEIVESDITKESCYRREEEDGRGHHQNYPGQDGGEGAGGRGGQDC